jgi:integrase/recombinase XerC
MNTLTLSNAQAITSFNFANFEKDFFASLDIKQETFRAYKKGVNSFIQYCQENNIVTPCNADIIAYKKYALSLFSGATVNLYISGLRRFFKYLASQGLYQDITIGVKGAKFNRYDKKDSLTSEQIVELLSSCDNTEQGKRNKAIIALMVTCGLRDIEVTRILKEDIVMEQGKFCVLIQGKYRDEKDEKMYINQGVYKLIAEYLEVKSDKKSKYLFSSTSNNNKGGLTTCSISSIVKNAFKKIGLNSSRLTAHSLRHTAVTLALLGGYQIQDVQVFARHANIATTQIYAHNINASKVKLDCSNAIANSLF